jgi:uncharacterized alpha/beta hydrolase family protein
MVVGSSNGTLHLIPYVEPPTSSKATPKVKKIADFHCGAVTGVCESDKEEE